MTAVDPRTIAVNAARWMLTDGWDGCRLDDGNPLIHGAGYTFNRNRYVDWHGVRVFRRQTIAVDLDGIHYSDSHPEREEQEQGWRLVVPTHGQRPTWADMACAVDHLCADRILPITLSTGWQAACLNHQELERRRRQRAGDRIPLRTVDLRTEVSRHVGQVA